MPTIAGWIAKGKWTKNGQEFRPPRNLPVGLRWDHEGPQFTADLNASASYANFASGENLYKFSDGSALVYGGGSDCEEVVGTVPGPWTEL